MTKILCIEIGENGKCLGGIEGCPHCEFNFKYDTLSPSGWYCHHNVVIEYIGKEDIIPKWCPLPDKKCIEKNEFQNKTYKAIIAELERLEIQGIYKGNGHHLAQRLCEMLWSEFKDNINKQ